MILFSPHILSIIAVESILLVFSCICLYSAIKISLDFDIKSTSPYQYKLSKRSYLLSVIVIFILGIKLPLFLYFIWGLDALSNIVPGAMCAAGIVSASKFGVYLLSLKIANLFFLCGWLFLNYHDFKSPISQYMKLKFALFQPLFLALVLEFILNLAHFSTLSSKTPVACCSVIFAQNPDAMPFYQNTSFILGLFILSFLLHVIFFTLKKPILFAFSSFILTISSTYALIRFFSPYIYELPTHLCPFCLLQKEYYFIGYLLYILIFTALLFALFALLEFLLKKRVNDKYFNLSLMTNCILFLLLFIYPIAYYFKNSVWLN